MTTEQIQQGNKLIAEFMGIETIIYYGKCLKVEGIQSIPIEYHSSWDWLMPVVEKIEALREGTIAPYDVDIENSECHIAYKNGSETISWVCDHKRSKIEVTWQAVVEFVKWHSEFVGELKD